MFTGSPLYEQNSLVFTDRFVELKRHLLVDDGTAHAREVPPREPVRVKKILNDTRNAFVLINRQIFMFRCFNFVNQRKV